MHIPSELKYASSHEWVRIEGSFAVVGISDFAQTELGELVFVELPDVGQKLKRDDPCAVVESVKTASDIYAPLSGMVIEVNHALAENAEKVNADPYGSWLFKMEMTDVDELAKLLNAEQYRKQIGN